jgi:hypothetical protein
MATVPNPQQVCAMFQAKQQVYQAGQSITLAALMQNTTVTTQTVVDLQLAAAWIATQPLAQLL